VADIISFHGSDHKSGVTMLAQSVCSDLCRRNPDKSIIFLGMNSRPSCDYVREETFSIEDIKIHLDNRTLTADEIKMMCRSRGNFYMLAGIKNLIICRDFFPETAEYLLNIIKSSFDLIVCDTGSDPDNGLAIGALQYSTQRYCIISQCESSISEFENKNWLFRRLGIEFDSLVLNKYFPKDPYDTTYLSERLGKSRDLFYTVRMAGYGRQAEMEHQTLLEYRNDSFGSDISVLADRIMAQAGWKSREIKTERRRKPWKTGSI
jgi:hypothetical protein